MIGTMQRERAAEETWSFVYCISALGSQEIACKGQTNTDITARMARTLGTRQKAKWVTHNSHFWDEKLIIRTEAPYFTHHQYGSLTRGHQLENKLKNKIV